MTELLTPESEVQGTDVSTSFMTNESQSFGVSPLSFSSNTCQKFRFSQLPRNPGYQRFFSRAAGFSVLAEGRHIFGRRPKPRHYKDLRETGNRARKVSGTQGSIKQPPLLNVQLTDLISDGDCIGNSMICNDIWHKYHE